MKIFKELIRVLLILFIFSFLLYCILNLPTDRYIEESNNKEFFIKEKIKTKGAEYDFSTYGLVGAFEKDKYYIVVKHLKKDSTITFRVNEKKYYNSPKKGYKINLNNYRDYLNK